MQASCHKIKITPINARDFKLKHLILSPFSPTPSSSPFLGGCHAGCDHFPVIVFFYNFLRSLQLKNLLSYNSCVLFMNLFAWSSLSRLWALNYGKWKLQYLFLNIHFSGCASSPNRILQLLTRSTRKINSYLYVEEFSKCNRTYPTGMNYGVGYMLLKIVDVKLLKGLPLDFTGNSLVRTAKS